ncbi:hypothetical protein ACFL0W_00730 [Nanoarchaeota archaeon]
MAKRSTISGWVFIVIGMVVGSISYLRESMRVFYYVALLLIGYGALKLTIFKPKEYQRPEKSKQGKKQQPAKRKYPSRCPTCYFPLHGLYRYCPGCGKQLKKREY